jgi:hypothetical protein
MVASDGYPSWHARLIRPVADPENLYRRERESDALLAAFDRVVANGAPELVLASGYSGVGKSSVVNELYKVLVPPRGPCSSAAERPSAYRLPSE